MSSVIGDEIKTQSYINEAGGNKLLGVKGLGVQFDSIDINRSGLNYEIQAGKILCPLTVVNGVGRSAVEEIVERREKINGGPFKNFRDFVYRIAKRSVTSAVVTKLAKSRSGNAFGNIGVKPEEALGLFERLKKEKDARKHDLGKFADVSIYEVCETSGWEK